MRKFGFIKNDFGVLRALRLDFQLPRDFERQKIDRADCETPIKIACILRFFQEKPRRRRPNASATIVP